MVKICYLKTRGNQNQWVLQFPLHLQRFRKCMVAAKAAFAKDGCASSDHCRWGSAVPPLPECKDGLQEGTALLFFPLHQNREVARDVSWNSPAAGPSHCPAVPKRRELKEISFMPSLILSFNTERENSTEKRDCEKLVSFHRSSPFPLVNIKQMLWPFNFYPLSFSPSLNDYIISKDVHEIFPDQLKFSLDKRKAMHIKSSRLLTCTDGSSLNSNCSGGHSGSLLTPKPPALHRTELAKTEQQGERCAHTGKGKHLKPYVSSLRVHKG